MGNDFSLNVIGEVCFVHWVPFVLFLRLRLQTQCMRLRIHQGFVLIYNYLVSACVARKGKKLTYEFYSML